MGSPKERTCAPCESLGRIQDFQMTRSCYIYTAVGVVVGLCLLAAFIYSLTSYDKELATTLALFANGSARPLYIYPETSPKRRPVCQKILRTFWDSKVEPEAERQFSPYHRACLRLPWFGNVTLKDLFKLHNFKEVKCMKRDVRFSDVSRPQVALSSYPGSGNTWIRHLLEPLSGVLTGSIYCGVVRNIFKAECLKINDHMLAIKTHKPYFVSRKFDKAVVVIRNPFDAILAEFNRLHASKTRVAPMHAFRSREWLSFVKKEASAWFEHVMSWLLLFPGPMYVLFYENLQTTFLEELLSVAWFLRVRPTYGELWCVYQDQEGIYHRSKPSWLNEIELYPTQLRTFIRMKVNSVRTVLNSEFNMTLPDPYSANRTRRHVSRL